MPVRIVPCSTAAPISIDQRYPRQSCFGEERFGGRISFFLFFDAAGHDYERHFLLQPCAMTPKCVNKPFHYEERNESIAAALPLFLNLWFRWRVPSESRRRSGRGRGQQQSNGIALRMESTNSFQNSCCYTELHGSCQEQHFTCTVDQNTKFLGRCL